jgi:acetyl-CoA carboxylase carboxyl transferase subunit alpha
VSRELEFERPVLELERKIEALRKIAQSGASLPPAGRASLPPAADRASLGAPDRPSLGSTVDISALAADGEPTLDVALEADGTSLDHQIAKLEDRARQLQEQVFSSLSRWQVVQLSRHPGRPYTFDYVERLLTEFTELHGDRCFGDDGALVGGIGRFRGRSVLLLGHQKGRNTKENMRRNFGMARPEGYRKAMRLMRLAERFRLPVITLIDTSGAYPGIDAEERGQSQAIAESLELMASLTVPIVSVVIGEGGSGGALAIGVANRVLMLEFSTYSVISPEGCASILFKDASHAERAADALRLTAPDLVQLNVVDGVVPEPPGGAHRDHDEAARRVGDAIAAALDALQPLDAEGLRADRYARFRRLGALDELGAAQLAGRATIVPGATQRSG